MFIIVGLGNPGDKYTGTRHNIGFDTITKLADEHNIKMDFMKHKALCGKGYIDGVDTYKIYNERFRELLL